MANLLTEVINSTKNLTTKGINDLYREQKDTIDPKNIKWWTTDGTNWYKNFPYQLVILNKKSVPNIQYIYTLPIPPEQIVTQVIPASQVTPTLGGAVEETSKNVFWTINLTGTTGVAIGRELGKTHLLPKADQFRATNGKGNFLQNIANNFLGGLSNTLNAVTDGISGGITSAAENLLLTRNYFSRSAVPAQTTSNGYLEIQYLQYFLDYYSILKDKDPKNWELYFYNYKK